MGAGDTVGLAFGGLDDKEDDAVVGEGLVELEGVTLAHDGGGWKLLAPLWSICNAVATMPPSSCPRRRTYPWRNAAGASTVWPSATVTNPTTPSLSASTSMQPAAAVCGTAPLAGAPTPFQDIQSPTSWPPVCTKPPRDTFPATGSVLTTATVIPTMKSHFTS